MVEILEESSRHAKDGHPVHTAELLAGIEGVCYSARGSLSSPSNLRKVKEYVKKAVTKQMEGKGLSFVEILSPCPPDWRMSPVEAVRFIEEKVIKEFPLGEFKDT